MKQKNILSILLPVIFVGSFLVYFLSFAYVFADEPGDVGTGPGPVKTLECKDGKVPTYNPETKKEECKCPSGQSPDKAGKCQLDNPAPRQLVSISDFRELLRKIIEIFLMFAGAIAVIFLMVGGFQYIASRGNEEATEKAKKTITNAVIGVVLIVMAFAIVNIINTLLTKTPPEQAPAGTGSTPSSSGGPGGTGNTSGGGSGGQTQGGITVQAIDRAFSYTQGDEIVINFQASPSGEYAWSNNSVSVYGIQMEIEPGAGDSSTAKLTWDTTGADVKVYQITVTAKNNNGQSGSLGVIIDLRAPAQPGP